MKIAIFSDSHDHQPNLEKFLDWADKNNITKLIFCGDLCAPAILKNIIAPKFKGAIHMVFGNVTDRELLPRVAAGFEQVVHHGDQGEIKIDKSTIGFVHYPKVAREMAASGRYDYVFYGHTHAPWQEKVNGCQLVNPGTLAGLFNKATFAVFDTKTNKLELKLLEKI